MKYHNLYKNILTPEQVDKFLKQLREGDLFKRETNLYVDNSLGCGYRFPYAESLIPHLTEIIKKDYGDNIRFTSLYTRIYKDKSFLKPHIDRDDLEITLSINLFSNLDEEWPMYVTVDTTDKPHNQAAKDFSKMMKNAIPYITNPGDGVACLGTKHVHWRENLYCRKDQEYIQAFFHWAYVKD
jgi:hypothetical protein